MSTAQQRTFRFFGEVVAIDAGDHLIQVQQVGPAAYRVEVLARGFVATPVDDLTASWATPDLAFAHADTLAALFLAESTPTSADNAIGNDGATQGTASTVPASADTAKARGMAALLTRQPNLRVSKPGVGLIGHISEPVYWALEAAAKNGKVERGRGPGRAPRQVLESAEKDGLLDLFPKTNGRPLNWDHGVLTVAGRTVLLGERALRAREAAKAGAR